MDLATATELAAYGFAAGVMNALAGGGTILTYPGLLGHGLDAIQANATSTVALVPGAASSAWVHRREVGAHRAWLRTLLLPSLLGGAAGSVLLGLTPERTFRGLAPWLVLFATGLFVLQTALARRPAETGGTEPDPEPPPSRRRTIAVAWQFAVGVYGGYFGAGIGILMLAMLGFVGVADMHAANGLKNVLGATINGVACAYFVLRGFVVWPAALATMAGAVLGGFVGAKFTRFVGREKARWAVVAVGLYVAWKLLSDA